MGGFGGLCWMFGLFYGVVCWFILVLGLCLFVGVCLMRSAVCRVGVFSCNIILTLGLCFCLLSFRVLVCAVRLGYDSGELWVGCDFGLI